MTCSCSDCKDLGHIHLHLGCPPNTSQKKKLHTCAEWEHYEFQQDERLLGFLGSSERPSFIQEIAAMKGEQQTNMCFTQAAYLQQVSEANVTQPRLFNVQEFASFKLHFIHLSPSLALANVLKQQDIQFCRCLIVPVTGPRVSLLTPLTERQTPRSSGTGKKGQS